MKAQKGPREGVFVGMLHKGNVRGEGSLPFGKAWADLLTKH